MWTNGIGKKNFKHSLKRSPPHHDLICELHREVFMVVYKLVNVVLTLEWYCVPVYQVS